jgi:hypothetical protein
LAASFAAANQRRIKGTAAMSLIKKGAIVLSAALFFVILMGLLNSPKKRSERIKEGCTREFADRGVERIQQCQLQIMARELGEAEDAKMRRAAE